MIEPPSLDGLPEGSAERIEAMARRVAMGFGVFEDVAVDDAALFPRHHGGRAGHGSKLDAAKVREILLSDETDDEAAERFGVHKSHVRAIRRGSVWGSVYEQVREEKRRLAEEPATAVA